MFGRPATQPSAAAIAWGFRSRFGLVVGSPLVGAASEVLEPFQLHCFAGFTRFRNRAKIREDPSGIDDSGAEPACFRPYRAFAGIRRRLPPESRRPD